MYEPRYLQVRPSAMISVTIVKKKPIEFARFL
jgi:hypothetical protein